MGTLARGVQSARTRRRDASGNTKRQIGLVCCYYKYSTCFLLYSIVRVALSVSGAFFDDPRICNTHNIRGIRRTSNLTF